MGEARGSHAAVATQGEMRRLTLLVLVTVVLTLEPHRPVTAERAGPAPPARQVVIGPPRPVTVAALPPLTPPAGPPGVKPFLPLDPARYAQAKQGLVPARARSSAWPLRQRSPQTFSS